MVLGVPSGSSCNVNDGTVPCTLPKINSGIPEIFPRAKCNCLILRFYLCIKSFAFEMFFPKDSTRQCYGHCITDVLKELSACIFKGQDV
jgi:hypothetical protein